MSHRQASILNMSTNLMQVNINIMKQFYCNSNKFNLSQTCIGHILDHIEAYARHGFKCTIGNTEKLLFPRLGAMALDTMERYKYFGLRSVRACGICRLRKGRSVTRDASRHDTQHVQSLLHRATADAIGAPARQGRKRSREKLMRHGVEQNSLVMHKTLF